MTQHSPGPWVADSVNYVVQAGTNDQIANVYGPQGLLEVEANANLIAAAPDLLDALKTALSECGRVLSDNTTNAIKTAIAKAEGR